MKKIALLPIVFLLIGGFDIACGATHRMRFRKNLKEGVDTTIKADTGDELLDSDHIPDIVIQMGQVTQVGRDAKAELNTKFTGKYLHRFHHWLSQLDLRNCVNVKSENITNFSALSQLMLDVTNMKNLDALSDMPSLTMLTLSSSGAIPKLDYSKFPKLNFLGLLGEVDENSLAKSQALRNQLTIFNIVSKNFTGKCLSNFTSLESCVISACPLVTDDHLTRLANTKLTFLSVMDCPQLTGKYFINLPSLETLSCDQDFANRNPETIKKLKDKGVTVNIIN